MHRSLTDVAASLAAAAPVAASHEPPIRRDVNFAMSGATAGALNLVDVFDPPTTAQIRARGLDTGGLKQQLDVAVRTLVDVDGERDVFSVWIGANSYLSGEADPSVPAGKISAALETLYTELGARKFIVPDLFPLGFFPTLKAFPDEVRVRLNGRALLHNQVLAATLAQFRASHRDAVVVSVDMASVFAAFLPTYDNVTDSCIDDRMPFGRSCEGILFFDALHLETGAGTAFGAAAAASFIAQAGDVPVRRVIAFGDSLSDTGAFFDVTLRATGVGSPPSPPHFAQRFSNGPIWIDVLEAQIGVELPSAFFSQPERVEITTVAAGQSGSLAGELLRRAAVYVPKSLPAAGHGAIHLLLGPVQCTYTAGPGGPFELSGCSHAAGAGDLIEVDRIELHAPPSVEGPLTVELLLY